MVTIEINGKRIEADEGSMVIQAADGAGIYIPRFCYHNKLSVAANCRMCLVEVEKAPKPVPACATPVVDGMKVFTRSPNAIAAQQATMEFLLINHPLDCPVCDQGGECDLQDIAVGYGGDVSHYREMKRVVKDKDLGPLIATEMTRCIHCTRCIRFGREIAGIMELGATGRGEHTKVGTYVERTVDSELSGNMIDLCPVGALTSKPFRFSARIWELTGVESVSPHDVVGSNLYLQTRRNKVMRVLPRENDEINETWLSDRDRYSYQALNGGGRLTKPMIRVNGRWQETDWSTALDFTVAGIAKVTQRHGAGRLGALASPNATLEEFYLLQKLMRGLGSHNVDHRLRQVDFNNDAEAPPFPWLGQSIKALEQRHAVLLVGSNIRKEQPLLGLRLRKAFLNGARLMAVNPVDYEFNFSLSNKIIVAPQEMLTALAKIATALGTRRGKALPAAVQSWLKGGYAGTPETAIAETLLEAGDGGCVVLGSFAASHPQYAGLHALAQIVAELSNARLGVLGEGNSAGAWLAGCVPHRGPVGTELGEAGRHVAGMIQEPLKGYLLLGLEPELDCLAGSTARVAMEAAEFIVMLSPFTTAARDYADVQLPLAPFSETSGTFVNCEGRAQRFCGAVEPLGDTRPGWKILRVLGNLLGLSGFDYASSAEVCNGVNWDGVTPSSRLKQWKLDAPPAGDKKSEINLERITEIPIYAVDPIVRRASALQQTADNPAPAARMNAAQARKFGLYEERAGLGVNVHKGEAIVTLGLVIDPRVPDGCTLIPAGYPETAALGGPGMVRVVRA